jgi:Flp pilus assembly protein TadD
MISSRNINTAFSRFTGMTLFLAGLSVACGVSIGCAHHAGDQQVQYKTVSEKPTRDSDVAHQANEEAIAAHARGDYDRAEAACRRALDADVMYAPAHNTLGLVYFARRQWYLAAWEFQYAVKLMPDNAAARNNLGMVFEASGKLDQAVETYTRAHGLEPDNAQYTGNLARARVRRGDSGNEVRDLLKELVNSDSRADWVDWARERLALMRGKSAD